MLLTYHTELNQRANKIQNTDELRVIMRKQSELIMYAMTIVALILSKNSLMAEDMAMKSLPNPMEVNANDTTEAILFLIDLYQDETEWT